MFALLGQLVRKAWPVLLLVWIGLLLAGRFAAPSWDEVAQDREFAFLPATAPSRQADDMLRQAFPDDRMGSSIVLVLWRASSQPGQQAGDLKFIEETLEPRLRQMAEAEGGLASEPAPSQEPLFGEEAPAPAAPPPHRSIIARIRTPNAPGSGRLLISPDGQALLVVLELTTEFLARTNWPTIQRVEELTRQLEAEGQMPPGLHIALTGSAVIGRDHSRAEYQSARATGRLTILLVIVLLIVIYRAPLLAIIPLATVYVAVELARALLAWQAGAGHLTLFQGLQIYITILAYGAGVDYCLFLTARYKEELDQGREPAQAVADSVAAVGAALVASAATVMCGIGMMLFAQFGKFREAGLAIPLSILLVLAATLTFSPALLRLAGRWAFWPHRLRAPGRHGEFLGTARLEQVWDRVGQLLLRRAGTVWLITVGLMAPFALLAGFLYNHLAYDLIGELPRDATSVAGTQVLREHFPPGVMGPITVLWVQPQLDFSSPAGRAAIERLTGALSEQRTELGLQDVRSLTAPLGLAHPGEEPLAGSDLPAEVRREAAQRGTLRHYVSDLGERARIGTRLELILAHSPFAHQSVVDLDRIEQAVRDALPTELQPDTQLYFAGTTASVRDLAAVMRADRSRIELLVLGSVLVILILILRRLLVPVYLLLSVLFSYYTTLGVTFLVFWLLDPAGFAGIDWKVAIFLFTILIAVGEDYNIFLTSRIDEEQRRRGALAGITHALSRTGPIISSCGIIMAGTFATLMAGSLTALVQLGFALAFGVLLDTFVVRPVLVPAFLILLHQGRLWPGRRPEQRQAAEAHAHG
jgi:RND superfamily putative drug exporter